ncbi:MAG: hypothetical protein JST78_09535 [Bacteroidetes bacterium]|nr:hypothetical protein [Bacteroidota bacterium]
MDKVAEFKRLLKEVANERGINFVMGTVISIEQDSCTVKITEDLVISDVKLSATIFDTPGDGLKLLPKIGTDALMISTSGKLTDLVLLKADNYSQIVFKQNGLEFLVDSVTKKVTLKNESVNLGQLINTLIDAVSAAQIINSDTTTGTLNPASIAALNNIKTQFNQILNAT